MRQRLLTVGRIAAVLGLLATTVLDAQAQAPDDLDALRRQVLARFEVVPLRTGVALVGRGADRRVEVADGLILDRGTPLSGADLRARLGGDAPLVVRLSYLDNDALRRLFAPPPTPAAPNAAPPPAVAPATAAPPPPPLTPAPPAEVRAYRRSGTRIAVGKSITVAENEEVTDGVVAIGGRIRIAGRVRDDVVAIGGSVELLPTADVRGDITALGGQVNIAPGARHSGAVHHAAGDWPGWSWPLVTGSWFDLGGAARWLTLAGTLGRVTVLGLAVALVLLVGGGRVERIRAAAAAAPFRSGLTGVAIQLLFVPVLIVVSLGLAITIVGLPFVALLIPLALVTMFVAMLIGFAGVAHGIGGWVARRMGWDVPSAIGAAILGVALVVLPTVLSRLVGVAPEAVRAVAFTLLAVGTVVEYTAWTVGLGAAAMTGLGRWATAPPPLPPPVPPPFDTPADAPSPV
jgi:hypothetical protein